MSTNTDICLSPATELDNVTRAVGILFGLKPYKRDLSGGSWATWVDGVIAEATSMPEMAMICLDGPVNFLKPPTTVYYHFEADQTNGMRLLSPYCHPAWIAAGRRLVDLFGGYIIYNDSLGRPRYSQPVKSWREIAPNGGKPWIRWQQKLLDLSPLTDEEVARFERWAEYR